MRTTFLRSVRMLPKLALALTLVALPLLSGLPSQDALAAVDPGAPSPLCSPPTDVNLTPNLGWFSTPPAVPISGLTCNRYFFELEPGTSAQVVVTLTVGGGTPVAPVVGAVTACSWDDRCSANSRLHEGGPTTWTSSVVANPYGASGRANHFFEVFGAGIGSVGVKLAYGSLPMDPLRDFGNAAAWRPTAVPAGSQKAPVTGDWDHTIYNDPSFPGLDACLALAGQNDANAFKDAPNAPDASFGIPLGDPPLFAGPTPNVVHLGQRGVYINNRIGLVAPCPSPRAPSGRPVDDSEDWYSFVVQPGGQVQVNIWPTRYEDYGGEFHYQFFRAIP
ncbi:MAG: hypothetical protein NTZ05_10365, partial [Chloroflexi bacterium]|nr:hypothetical protein [Chloroflexota bacterium]